MLVSGVVAACCVLASLALISNPRPVRPGECLGVCQARRLHIENAASIDGRARLRSGVGRARQYRRATRVATRAWHGRQNLAAC